jgi:uncharacterized membrane protein YgcG
MQAGLAVKHSAQEAWEAIRKIRLGADRVKEANAEWLRREFGDLAFKSGESVEDFLLRLTTVARQLWVLSDSITDKDVIKKLLHVVPEKLEQVVISMETLLDLDSHSIEEAVGHLCVVEQGKKPSATKDNDGRLLLTEEEWLSHWKACDGSSSSFSNRTSNGNGNGGKTGGKGKSGSKQSAGSDLKGAAG